MESIIPIKSVDCLFGIPYSNPSIGTALDPKTVEKQIKVVRIVILPL